MKIKLPFILFLCLQCHLTGAFGQQDIDKIIAEAARLAWIDLDSCENYLAQELERPDIKADKKATLHLYLAMSRAYIHVYNGDAMKAWKDRAQRLLEQIGEPNERAVAEIIYQESFIAFCQDDHQKALDRCFQALETMEQLGYERGIAIGHFYLGVYNHYTYEYALSAEYAEQAADRFEQLGELVPAADALNLAGHGYRQGGDSTRTMLLFERHLQIAEKVQHDKILAVSYKNLCFYYLDFGDEPEKGLEFGLKGLQLLPASEERQRMLLHNNLAQLYLKIKDYKEVIKYTNLAMEWINKNNDQFFLSVVPKYLALAYEGLGQYDSAYKYLYIDWVYSDSLFQKEKNEALIELNTRYETGKKEATIAAQEEQLKQQQLVQYLIIGIAALLAAILLILYRNFRSKQRTNLYLNTLNDSLEKKNQENELLLKEIHHRVKNNLQVISSLLSLQSANIDDPKVLDAVQESQNRVKSMGLIHQKLYQGDNLAAIEMKDYLHTLSESMIDSFGEQAEDVEIECDMNELELDVDTAIPIGLIVNELITNAIKYAFPDGREGQISMSLDIDADNLLRLVVADNGVGLQEEAVSAIGAGTGFGSQLVNLLTLQLNGKMHQETEGGMRTEIRFKQYKAA